MSLNVAFYIVLYRAKWPLMVEFHLCNVIRNFNICEKMNIRRTCRLGSHPTSLNTIIITLMSSYLHGSDRALIYFTTCFIFDSNQITNYRINFYEWSDLGLAQLNPINKANFAYEQWMRNKISLFISRGLHLYMIFRVDEGILCLKICIKLSGYSERMKLLVFWDLDAL